MQHANVHSARMLPTSILVLAGAVVCQAGATDSSFAGPGMVVMAIGAALLRVSYLKAAQHQHTPTASRE